MKWTSYLCGLLCLAMFNACHSADNNSKRGTSGGGHLLQQLVTEQEQEEAELLKALVQITKKLYPTMTPDQITEFLTKTFEKEQAEQQQRAHHERKHSV